MRTEQLAVLFTDLVGSTELSQAHAPDTAEQIRRQHNAILRQAITEHAGTEVKNLGDGVMVVFGAASAALACAVAMQQRVDLDNHRQKRSGGLRVGISAGEVVHDEGDYFGDAVVEAARLCAQCAGGQVLLAEVVHLMAGRRNTHECRPVGALTLKGLNTPVEAMEILWPRLEHKAATSRIPLPARIERPAERFVGRGNELDLINASFARVSAASAREFVLVGGEAGLGKTTMTTRAARTAFEQGANVLFGHCEEDLVTPYQLFAETLRHYVTHAPEDELRAHVAEHGSELVRIVPALAGRIPDLPPTKATDADSERSLLFAAVVGMLATAADERPLVLLLDDIQWADKGSLILLRHIATIDRPLRLLVLATYRDNELGALLDTLAALHRQTGVTRIDLKGLDDGEVLQCVESIVRGAQSDTALALARAVHSETDGNPFFVTELLRHLTDTGVLSQNGRWSPAGGIEKLALPDSVREVIGARVTRLGSECGRVLGLAAVIGRDFDFDLLARATEMNENALLDVLDSAVDAALIQELSEGVGRYHFAHGLIQHALYEDLSATRRAKSHRTIAVSLDELCGAAPGLRIGELARHWCHAPTRDDAPKAAAYAYQAGNAALSALAPSDAIDYFTTAKKLITDQGVNDSALELDLAIGLGAAQRQTGDPASRETLLAAGKRAAESGDTERLVRAVLANDRGWHSTTGAADAEKIALLELALGRLPAGVPDRALVLGTLCAELAFGSALDRRRALADEALAIAEATGDDAIIVRTLNHMAFSLTLPSLLESSLKWTADALARAERLGDPMQLYFAAMYRATAAVRANDIAEADRCYAIAGALVHQLALPPLRWEYGFHMSKRAQLAGDLAEAERLAGEAASVGASCGQPDAQTFFGVQLAAISWMRGTMGDLAPLLEMMMQANPGLPTIRASLAMAFAQAGRVEDAARILSEFAATGYALPEDAAWLNGMTEYADAAINCGDANTAPSLYDLLLPWAAHFSAAGGLTAEGPVCLYLGGLATMLGRYDDAARHLSLADELCARHAMKYFAARTNLQRAQLMLRRGLEGDADTARTLLKDASSAAAANGYGAVARQADETLARIKA
ncbi:MAG: AAA family ATPase [Alphaproteobacteria bacterium]|nr:AAA family ATPase [Alphaproteobacteria bacterium]